MELVEFSAFILTKNDSILVEKRKLSKAVDSGLVANPHGHCEQGETIEQTLVREMVEELGVPNMNNYWHQFLKYTLKSPFFIFLYTRLN